MRIGILGGAFDPPHCGHVTLAAWALATQNLNELWVVPCWDHGFGKQMSPYKDRLQMCRETFHSVFTAGAKVWVRNDECRLRTHYTIDLIEHLRKANPQDQFVLIIGGDNWRDRNKWHRWDELSQMVEVAVCGRDARDKTPGVFEFILSGTSSTDIRTAISHDDADMTLNVLPTAARKYIMNHDLY